MHFEQTTEWARFQQVVGRRVFILSPSKFIEFEQGLTRADGEGVAVERAVMGGLNFLEVNGWVGVPERAEKTVEVLKNAGRETGAVFVRWTPPQEASSLNLQVSSLKDLRAVAPKVLVHQVPPRVTSVLDLAQDESDLLKQMHEKTRYNIRLAERKGVVIRQIKPRDEDAFDSFWRLMQATATRDEIGVHSREYYRMMLRTLIGGGAQAHLFLAEYGGVSLATAILITRAVTATYLHGGSSNAQRNLMAPYLLQWRMIQWAQRQGMRWYDMWGIAPLVASVSRHPWAGITRFKMGFGGEVRESRGTFDIICRPFVYNVLSLGRMLKQVF